MVKDPVGGQALIENGGGDLELRRRTVLLVRNAAARHGAEGALQK